MEQLGRILAATDLSAPARHAVQRAALVSRETDATLALLHVANLAPLDRLRRLIGTPLPAMQEQVIDAARRQLDALSASLLQRCGVAADVHIATGNVVSELARQVQALAAGLLVCGARGESVIRHFALGSTASRTLGMVPCPVLVVKAAPHEPYRRVLLAVDFSPGAEQALAHARLVAPGAEIVLLHACQLPFEGHLRYAGVDEESIRQARMTAEHEALVGLRALGADSGCELVLHGDPAMTILQQEEVCDSDLVVVGKHGEHLFEKLFVGSVTGRVLAESQGDVLVSV